MIIKKTIRAQNTFGIIQDAYGARIEIPVDYLAYIIRDNGEHAVIPLKLMPLDEVEGYKEFIVKDWNGRTIPFTEIEERFGGV